MLLDKQPTVIKSKNYALVQGCGFPLHKPSHACFLLTRHQIAFNRQTCDHLSISWFYLWPLLTAHHSNMNSLLPEKLSKYHRKYWCIIIKTPLVLKNALLFSGIVYFTTGFINPKLLNSSVVIYTICTFINMKTAMLKSVHAIYITQSGKVNVVVLTRDASESWWDHGCEKHNAESSHCRSVAAAH